MDPTSLPCSVEKSGVRTAFNGGCYIHHLDHPLLDVRSRSLRSIVFKLSTGLLHASDLMHERDFLAHLLEWFNFEEVTMEGQVLSLISQLTEVRTNECPATCMYFRKIPSNECPATCMYFREIPSNESPATCMYFREIPWWETTMQQIVA